MKKALLLLIFLTSCSGNNDEWILQSYDKTKGYTFTRNGVSYQTTCFATGRPMLSDTVPDTSPDSLPPNPAFDGEVDCSDILPFLHKPIPDFRQVDGSLLVFTEKQNFKLEFEIKEAK
jgi:hypothetical protein